MKLLGAALILCGAALHGRTLLASRRRERDALRELSAALAALELGVRTTLRPLPELLARRGQGAYADAFFSAVSACGTDGALPERWRSAAAALPLRVRERQSVEQVAEAFGGEEEDVLRALTLASHTLRETLRERERDSARETRLATTLCFSFGALLAILLI